MAITPLTTAEAVKNTAPDLTNSMSDDTLKMLIQDATSQVLSDQFPEHVQVGGQELPIREEAARYFTLHLCSMDSKSAQGVQTEQVDVIKRQYFSKNIQGQRWIDSSIWGRRYKRLLDQYGQVDDISWIVAEH